MRIFLTFIIFTQVAIHALAQDSLWVQINIPVACIREGKSHAAEMSSQAIMGTPMLVLENDGGEWLGLRSPEGYEGYVNVSSIVPVGHDDMIAWRRSPRVTVTSLDETRLYADTLSQAARSVVSTLVNGSILSGRKSDGRFSCVSLPDGRTGWIENRFITPAEQWASTPFDADSILDRCYMLMGTPYLWGGNSTKSVDCSGLVRVAYYANGILTLRDARQQIGIGRRIEPSDSASLRPADLLFFSSEPAGRITHVAIYDKDNTYIHSSGRVKTNRMTADDPDFSARVYRGASRIDGMTGTPGIWQIINHPWYFSSTP